MATPPWKIRPMLDFSSARPAGFTVERVHNPFTDQARVEILTDSATGRRLWPNRSQAQAAIDYREACDRDTPTTTPGKAS